MGIKVIHTGDWHIGSFRSPEEDGVNLRSEDTIRCLDELVRVARGEHPELVLASGDIFDRAEIWQGRSHKEVLQARRAIMELSKAAGHVVVMRGTPNHDSAEAFEELKAHFELIDNVDVVMEPGVIQTEKFDIAVLPGFDRGVFRAQYPGLSKEEENKVFTEELGNIVLGLKAQCRPGKGSILMAHYTVPGCNMESGQKMMLAQFEPVLPLECLNAAGYDLVALGHIHRPQEITGIKNCFYSGAINQMNFNDEGQERGFLVHDFEEVEAGMAIEDSQFFKTPYREHLTIHLDDEEIAAINCGRYEEVALRNWRFTGILMGKIVRVQYSCSYENHKALNKAVLEKGLLADGAFMVWEILPEKVDGMADRTNMSGTTDPEKNLREYLERKEYPEDKIEELVLKARPIIAMAEASISTTAAAGAFEPIEIEVKNYRNYEQEKFSFEDISFCTINGQNGAGKSSLFMDAIIDCLYEEPREGDLTGWIRNDEKVKSGSIMFTFRIGDKTFRVTRTRTKSGKPTLNLAELVGGEWCSRSKEKQRDTQEEIINILGMDSLTFKSCALIMQDQYGLFLQAPKEDRMVVLGNLLGLGVYEGMYKIAADKAGEAGARVDGLKQKIEVHNATIMGYGNPADEIGQAEEELQIIAGKAKGLAKERDARNLELLSMEEAQIRCDKLLGSIASLEQKKAATESNKGIQEGIISSSRAALEGEPAIVEKAGRYRELEARRNELAGAAALFGTKREEASRELEKAASLKAGLAKAEQKLLSEQGRLAAYEDTSGDDEIVRKAGEYHEARAALDRMQELALKHRDAEQKVQAAKSAQKGTEQEIEMLDKMIASTREFLGKDIAILSDNCGCIDIENADCMFLEKAKGAKETLQEEEKKYREKREGLERILAQRISEVEAAEKGRDGLQYDAGGKKDAERRCEELLPYVEKAERVKKKAGDAALARATVDNAKMNVLDLEKRVAEADAEVARIQTELEQYQGAFEESSKVSVEMGMLAQWVEQEKQLPVIKERLSNALQRLAELEQQANEQGQELLEKNGELKEESLKAEGLAEKQEEVGRLDAELENANGEIKAIQMKVGALKEKLEQIGKLEKEISALQEQEREAAKEAADYATLKAAFSQDGIPHQIIRAVVPKLADTANAILMQMTSGNMGVQFKTEKVMKSNSKKEVVTLDVFIEENGRPALPYLSKSGGEKVKASLSVILSLAEIKSSSAGIQLGMLFIDEAPFLDGEGVQAYVDALETIQRRYAGIKVMAITHDPTFKARFPQSITVSKDEYGSHVRWD